jgi:REP element-mobilizing transposase RayT
MAGTFASVTLHIVFSTKGRGTWITEKIETRLHAFMGGIVRDQKGKPLAIGGIEDHVHLLVGWRTDSTIADLVRHVKTRSSRWMRESIAIREFAWQEGYSVFSVSPSMMPRARQYILTQREHHTSRDFKSELLALLKAHNVDFDERYVFD